MKIKGIAIVSLLFCTIGFAAKAQEAGVVKGVVMERGTPNRIASAEVVNKKNKRSVRSNDFGLFQVGAAPGDTLLIYKQDYSDVEVVVAGSKDLVVYLNRAATTLNTVTIYGQTKQQEMNDMKKEYRNKGSFYAGKPPLLSYVFTPLTAIYELFGRTPKNARRFNKFYATEMQQSEVDRFFNQSLIQKYTDLKDKELEAFMLNYRPDYEKVQKWSDYDALKYIQDSYKKFKAAPPVN